MLTSTNEREIEMVSMVAIHKYLGHVLITDCCLAMQAMNPDPTSIYVEHDGDIKEVSKNMVSVELQNQIKRRDGE